MKIIQEFLAKASLVAYIRVLETDNAIVREPILRKAYKHNLMDIITKVLGTKKANQVIYATTGSSNNLSSDPQQSDNQKSYIDFLRDQLIDIDNQTPSTKAWLNKHLSPNALMYFNIFSTADYSKLKNIYDNTQDIPVILSSGELSKISNLSLSDLYTISTYYCLNFINDVMTFSLISLGILKHEYICEHNVNINDFMEMFQSNLNIFLNKDISNQVIHVLLPYLNVDSMLKIGYCIGKYYVNHESSIGKWLPTNVDDVHSYDEISNSLIRCKYDYYMSYKSKSLGKAHNQVSILTRDSNQNLQLINQLDNILAKRNKSKVIMSYVSWDSLAKNLLQQQKVIAHLAQKASTNLAKIRSKNQRTGFGVYYHSNQGHHKYNFKSKIHKALNKKYNKRYKKQRKNLGSFIIHVYKRAQKSQEKTIHL